MSHFNYIFPDNTENNWSYFALGKSVAYHYNVWDDIRSLLPVKLAADNFADTLQDIFYAHMDELADGHREPPRQAVQRLADWLDPNQTYTLYNDGGDLPTVLPDVPTWWNCKGYLWGTDDTDMFDRVGYLTIPLAYQDGSIRGGGYTAKDVEELRQYLKRYPHSPRIQGWAHD